MGKKYRSKWDRIIDAARDIADSYDTPVTLRQLFYRLIAALLFTNTDGNYTYLSKLTAEGRRDGTFPELIDTTREIVEPLFFADGTITIRYVARFYRGDRLADQPFSVYLGVEKRGYIAQLDEWFGEPYNIPILPLGGMTSQSFINIVKTDAALREPETPTARRYCSTPATSTLPGSPSTGCSPIARPEVSRSSVASH